MRMSIRILLVSLPLAAWFSAWAQAESARFVVPEGDLPSANVAGYRIEFTRNGSFAVSKNGQYLFDGGLIYALPGWKEWGTQIRRSDHNDRWELNPEGTGKLVTHGTLFDLNRIKTFTFVQQTELIAGGLRFECDVTPLVKRQLGGFGLVFHFPVVQTLEGQTTFWPGFRSVTMPEELVRGVLHRGNARAATILASGHPLVAIVGSRKMRWTLLDYRRWDVNSFRLIGFDSALTASLERGETGSFSFEVLLGDSAFSGLPLGPGQCRIDPYGRIGIWAAGRKIAEGCLASDGGTTRWLHETATRPRHDAPGAHGRATRVSNTADVDGTTMAYSAQIDAESGSTAVVTYTARKLDAQQPAPTITFTLAVPASELAAPPSAGTPTKTRTSPALVTTEQPPLEHALAVAYRDGHILELAADSPWMVRDATIDGLECHLLSIPTAAAGDGDLIASVHLRLSMTQARMNGDP